MKTRIILFVAICSIATLSFTFVSVQNQEKETESSIQELNSDVPIGGFVAEESL